MRRPTLFADEAPIPAEAPRAPEGPFAQVAIEQSLDHSLTYSIPRPLRAALRVGQRVRVPLGRNNKPVFGCVVAIRDVAGTSAALKPITKIVDPRALVTPPLLELSRWMSRYYCTPLGAVLQAVIPAAVRQGIGLSTISRVRLAASRAILQETLETTRSAKRRALCARLLQIPEDGAIDLFRLAAEANTTPASVRKLAKLKLISIAREDDFETIEDDRFAVLVPPPAIVPELNPDQFAALETLNRNIDAAGFSVNLLLGVTGSGKTELYLRAIQRVVARGRQAIVLVPELALTPQTVARFAGRFSNLAVLHSGLTPSQRHHHWRRIFQGQANVVIGARSAIFAPVKNLGIVVIDEEHESSYKDDSAPRYHARDLAIMRGRFENACVLLGSATPSLESFHRVQSEIARREKRNAAPAPSPLLPVPAPADPAGVSSFPILPGLPAPIPDPIPASDALTDAQPRPSSAQLSPAQPASAEPPRYELIHLPRRVRGLALPHIELIDMRNISRLRKGVHLLSPRLEFLLDATLKSKQQAILLLNRRGYSNFVYCASCGEALQCKYCDTTMTYHRWAGASAPHATAREGMHVGQLNCHYCLAANALTENCANCGKKLILFGMGTQRVEEELMKKFPGIPYARLDSDAMRNGRDFDETLGKFARGEIQVLLGTQMIAKGLDFPNVTLVGVISGDTALALPDFRASERTFQLITQVAGRAGRGDAPGRVILQTFLPDDPAIQCALRHDYLRFANQELANRRQVGLPPISRMARIVMRDQDLEKLHLLGEKVAAALLPAVDASAGKVVMKGPMPAAITRIANYHRHQIVLLGATAGAIQKVLLAAREQKAFSAHERVAVDVDPVSLL